MDLELRGRAVVVSDPPGVVSLKPPDRPDILVRGSLLFEAALRPGLCIPFMPLRLLTKPFAAGLFKALQLTAAEDEEALWPPELPSRLIGRYGLDVEILGDGLRRFRA